MQIHAIVLAGGDGDRFGGEMPKQFVRLAGEPILLRSVRAIGGRRRPADRRHPSQLARRHARCSTAQASDARRDRARRRDPKRERPGRPARARRRRRGHRPRARCRPAARVPGGDPALHRADPVGRGGRHGYRHRKRGHAGHRRRGHGRRDPGAQSVPPRPDTADLPRARAPQAYASAVAAGDLTATDDCSLVLRYVPGVRIVAVAGDEVEPEDHDADGHDPG